MILLYKQNFIFKIIRKFLNFNELNIVDYVNERLKINQNIECNEIDE